MKKLLATTALVVMTASVAFADIEAPVNETNTNSTVDAAFNTDFAFEAGVEITEAFAALDVLDDTYGEVSTDQTEINNLLEEIAELERTDDFISLTAGSLTFAADGTSTFVAPTLVATDNDNAIKEAGVELRGLVYGALFGSSATEFDGNVKNAGGYVGEAADYLIAANDDIYVKLQAALTAGNIAAVQTIIDAYEETYNIPFNTALTEIRDIETKIVQIETREHDSTTVVDSNNSVDAEHINSNEYIFSAQ